MDQRNYIYCYEAKLPTDIRHIQSVHTQSIHDVHNIVPYMPLPVGNAVRHKGYSVEDYHGINKNGVVQLATPAIAIKPNESQLSIR
jgi:hypothetical protein